MAKTELETFGFRPKFEIEVDPGFPAHGNWADPAFLFESDGTVVRDQHASAGAQLVARITVDGETWVGFFLLDGVGPASRFLATPSPTKFCIIGEAAHLIDVTRPEAGSLEILSMARSATVNSDLSQLIINGYSDIAALDNNGVQWTSYGVTVDHLAVVSADDATILCTGWDYSRAEEYYEIRIDPSTGEMLDNSSSH